MSCGPCRQDFAEGHDPVLEAKAKAERERQPMARITNFEIAAQSYIKLQAEWIGGSSAGVGRLVCSMKVL